MPWHYQWDASENLWRIITVPEVLSRSDDSRLRAGVASRIQPQSLSKLLVILCTLLGLEKVARQVGI
jgi:hypothetical protein